MKLTQWCVKMVQNLSSLLTFSAPSLSHVQSGKDSGPRRKAPGIPVNKDTPATKLGKHEVSVTKSERRGLHRMSFFWCFFGFRPCEGIPSIARGGYGEILITAFRSHYSKPRCPRYLNSGAIVDMICCCCHGNTEEKNLMAYSVSFYCGLHYFLRHHQKVQLTTSSNRTSATWQRVSLRQTVAVTDEDWEYQSYLRNVKSTHYHQQTLACYCMPWAQRSKNDSINIQSGKNTQHSTTSVPCTDIQCSLVWLCLEDRRGSLKRSKTPVMRLYRSSDLRWTILPHRRWVHMPEIMKNCRNVWQSLVKQSFCVRPAETSCRHFTSALHSERDGNQTHKKSKEESSRPSPSHSSPRYSQRITTRVSPFCLMGIGHLFMSCRAFSKA